MELHEPPPIELPEPILPARVGSLPGRKLRSEECAYLEGALPLLH